jgi:hypothetical protein
MRIDAIILRELHLPLVRPFETSFGVTRDRRILLAEMQSEGLTGWGECTAGERPFFSAESTDSAWQVIVNELAPMLAAADSRARRRVPEDLPPGARQPHGQGGAGKRHLGSGGAARRDFAGQLMGGVRDVIPCGVSLGIQPSIPELMANRKELAAGYQRIKLKCKPGWDVEVFEKVRSRWPEIHAELRRQLGLPLRDADHLVSFDAFDLLMIEQPLWHDDFYYHSMLQKRLQDADLPGRIDPQPARRAGGHRDGVVPDHQHQAGPRGRILRGDRRAQRGAGAGHSGLVRRNAGVGHRARAQHRALDAGELHAAGRCFGVGALLGRRHHRAGSDGFAAGEIAIPRRQAAATKCDEVRPGRAAHRAQGRRFGRVRSRWSGRKPCWDW